MNRSNQPESEQSLAHIKSDEMAYNADPAQIKYRKAVREISKLINMIKSLKNQIGSLENQLNVTYQNNQSLQTRINQLQDALNTRADQLTPNQDKNYHNEKQLENTGCISQFLDVKKRAQQLEQLLTQKQKNISELQTVLKTKHLQNIQIFKKCQKFKEQLQNLKQNQPQKNYGNQCSLEKQILHNQVKKSQQYIQFLTNQCHRLKQEQLKNTFGTNAALFSNMPNISNINSHQFTTTGMRSPKLLFKANNLTNFTDNKKYNELKNQFRHKKQKYRKEIKNLKQQISFYLDRYEKVLIFIQKQQKFIEKCLLVPSTNNNNFGFSGNLNNFNNNSAFTQNEFEHDVYKL